MDEDEQHIKYLEMIQMLIARMANNGFAIKGWSTALVSVILAFLAKDGKPEYAWIALLPAMVFWTLDAYFLGLEHAYRNLYDKVRSGSRCDFDLKPPAADIRGLLFSPAVASLHLMLVVVTVIVWCTRV